MAIIESVYGLELFKNQNYPQLYQNCGNLPLSCGRVNQICGVIAALLLLTGVVFIVWRQLTAQTLSRLRSIEAQLRETQSRYRAIAERQEEIVKQRTQELEREITRREANENILKQQNELFQTVVNNIPVMLSFYDERPQFHWVNEEWNKVLGWTVEEMKGKNMMLEFYPDEEIRQSAINFMQSADSSWKEFQTRIKDGSTITTSWANVRLSDGKVIGIGQDVSEREKMQSALKASEAKYKLLFESNPHPLWVYELETGEFLEVNESAIYHYGYSREQFLEMTIYDIRPPEDREKLQEHFKNNLEALNNAGIWRHRKANGETIEVEIISHQIMFAGKNARLVLAHDVTASRKAQQALRESEERFRLAMTNAPLPIILHAEDGEILQINEVWTELTGYTHQEIPTVELWTEKAYGERKILVQPVIDRLYELDEKVYEGVFPVTIKSGERRFWDFSSAPLGRLPDGRRLVMSMALDVTAQKLAEERLRYDAFHDTLTALPNRLFLMNRVEKCLERTRRENAYLFAILFIDLDRFKIVNDSLGHFVGDQLLLAIAIRLRESVKPPHTVARLGGDEFIILLENLPAPLSALTVAGRICDSFQECFTIDGQQFFISASIGIAFNSVDNLQPVDILRNADLAMYHAKENGKGRYAIFDPVMHRRANQLLEIETDLRRALENEEFIVYYQPIVSLADGKLVGFEALARWLHPSRGLISPADFIPVAEETGLIVPLGKSLLSQACRQLKSWQERYNFLDKIKITVNLSGRQLQHQDLIEQIDLILGETGLDGSCLNLEMTESILMKNTDMTSEILSQIRERRISISIDDFGTGYSSLSYLHRLPVDILKIDRSFVAGMSDLGENLEIVEAIITLAHHLGVSVVAEGIETEQHLQRLKALNCEFGQGYVIARPLDPESAESYLRYELEGV
ncbi:MAG: EAL domain-containing protein [Chlorogloea purpurea SAG 13.99]|nr:EAL domain-containing protein [Chlorogloea purpurea SAG 13.99]